MEVEDRMQKWSELSTREQIWRLAFFASAFFFGFNMLYLLVPSAFLALVYGLACGVIAVWQSPRPHVKAEYAEQQLEQDAQEHEAA